jgi:hypothetical protein
MPSRPQARIALPTANVIFLPNELKSWHLRQTSPAMLPICPRGIDAAFSETNALQI